MEGMIGRAPRGEGSGRSSFRPRSSCAAMTPMRSISQKRRSGSSRPPSTRTVIERTQKREPVVVRVGDEAAHARLSSHGPSGSRYRKHLRSNRAV